MTGNTGKRVHALIKDEWSEQRLQLGSPRAGAAVVVIDKAKTNVDKLCNLDDPIRKKLDADQEKLAEIAKNAPGERLPL